MNIKFDKININYENIKAVNSFSYEFTEGVYGLIGENGAGKTSLMNVMAGVFLPDSGNIYVDDNIINAKNNEYSKNIGYLPQVNPMYPEFTVYEYMKYICYLKCVKPQANKKLHFSGINFLRRPSSRINSLETDFFETNSLEIDSLLKLVNLEDKKNEKCKKLSGGMKRRLGIAQALIGNPKFLILDEPTAGVDVMERVKFRNIISSLGKERIVLFSTHTISDVERIANKIIILKKGKIAASGIVADMLHNLERKVWSAEVKLLDYEKIVNECGEKRVTNVSIQDYMYKIRYVYDKPIVNNAKNVFPSIEEIYADVMND